MRSWGVRRHRSRDTDGSVPVWLPRLLRGVGIDFTVEVRGSSPPALTAALRSHWAMHEVAEDSAAALALALGASAGGRRPLAVTAFEGIAGAGETLQAVLQAHGPMLLALHSGSDGDPPLPTLGAAIGLLRDLHVPVIAVEPWLRDAHYSALAREALKEQGVAALLLPQEGT